MPDQKTVRVRIAVAVNRVGNWSASGHSHADDTESSGIAVDDIGGVTQVHFVEADIPIPQPQTIKGTVQ